MIDIHIRFPIRIPSQSTAGETTRTESPHKYNLEEIRAMAKRTGFLCEAQWVDSEWPFAQNLWIAE